MIVFLGPNLAFDHPVQNLYFHLKIYYIKLNKLKIDYIEILIKIDKTLQIQLEEHIFERPN